MSGTSRHGDKSQPIAKELHLHEYVNVAALVGCFGSLGSMTSNWLISSRISHTASAKCFSLEIRQANYTARHQPVSLYSQHNCSFSR
jgi:hypothetical protein